MIRLSLPYADESLAALRVGEEVLLSGRLLVGRDQVHRRLFDLAMAGEPLPVDIRGQAIYYMGPSPAPAGYPIGAAGPTTSARMDPYSPLLMDLGLRLMVGKGPRSSAVKDAVARNKGAYLYTYGGCGALYSSRIKRSKVLAWPELGPEALLELEVEDFPAFCVLDGAGGVWPGV